MQPDERRLVEPDMARRRRREIGRGDVVRRTAERGDDVVDVPRLEEPTDRAHGPAIAGDRRRRRFGVRRSVDERRRAPAPSRLPTAQRLRAPTRRTARSPTPTRRTARRARAVGAATATGAASGARAWPSTSTRVACHVRPRPALRRPGASGEQHRRCDSSVRARSIARAIASGSRGIEACRGFVEHLGQRRAGSNRSPGCRTLPPRARAVRTPPRTTASPTRRGPLVDGDHLVVVDRPGEHDPVGDARFGRPALPPPQHRRRVRAWRSRGGASRGAPDRRDPTPRCSPSVFLRSSPPVTATTYSPTSGWQHPVGTGSGSCVHGRELRFDAGTDHRDAIDRVVEFVGGGRRGELRDGEQRVGRPSERCPQQRLSSGARLRPDTARGIGTG